MPQEDLPIVNLSYRTIMEAFNAYITEEKPALESPTVCQGRIGARIWSRLPALIQLVHTG